MKNPVFIATIVIVVCMILPSTVMAMVVEEPTVGGDELKVEPTIDQQVQLPTNNIKDIYIPKEKTIKYTSKETIISQIVTTFSEILGLRQEEKSETIRDISVEIDGKVVAIIPEDSPLKNITIHDDCLNEGYGTTRWLSCEAFFQ